MRSMWMAALTLGLLVPALPADEKKKDEKKKDEKKAEAKSYEVEVVKDIAYNSDKDADKVRHALDLYIPKGGKDCPVFFFVHGGAWVGGSKKIFTRTGQTLAKMGIVCVSTNYRLSTRGRDSKVKHPDHIKDVAKAFAWTVNNIAKRGGNPKQIYISGHSAGGHLVALLGTDESYLKDEKLSLDNIKGVLPISGVFTVRGQIFGGADSSKKASPLTHVKKKLPPFLVFYAEKELGALGRQAETFGKAMKKAEAVCEVKVIKDRNHGSIMFSTAKADDPVTVAIVAFITKHGGLKAETKTESKEK